MPSALIKMKVTGKKESSTGAQEGYLEMYVSLCVCVCLCVCARERDRERERKRHCTLFYSYSPFTNTLKLVFC